MPRHQVDLFRFDITDESFLDLRNLVNTEHIIILQKTLLASMRLKWKYPKILLVPALKRLQWLWREALNQEVTMWPLLI